MQGQPNADAIVEAIARDYRDAPLSAVDRAMLDFAVKLTLQPHAMRRDDVQTLRRLGMDDRTVSHVVQVAALFNYYTRLADGLGIDPEPDWLPTGSAP